MARKKSIADIRNQVNRILQRFAYGNSKSYTPERSNRMYRAAENYVRNIGNSKSQAKADREYRSLLNKGLEAMNKGDRETAKKYNDKVIAAYEKAQNRKYSRSTYMGTNAG